MVTFSKLWNNHPTNTKNQYPCSTNGKSNFSNQCAIRMGVCLTMCGVDTTKMVGITHCWYHNKSQGHTVRAEELAEALGKHSVLGIQKVQMINPTEFSRILRGKRGIIFFKDYWQRAGETYRNRSGDHIDLWNGYNLTSMTALHRLLQIISGGIYDYYTDSKFIESRSICFWRVM